MMDQNTVHSAFISYLLAALITIVQPITQITETDKFLKKCDQKTAD